MNVKTYRSLCRLKNLGTAFLIAAASFASAAAPQGFPAQRIIVKYKPALLSSQRQHATASALADISARHGVTLKKLRTLTTGAEVIALEHRLPKANFQALLATVATRSDVEYAEEDRLLKRTVIPNDNRYTEQWHYFQDTAGINLPNAWNLSTGAGINVAVVDTGYRPHADLAANILSGYDFISDLFVARDGNHRDNDAQDPGDWTEANECIEGESAESSSWHGTHVAGTIAALTHNTTGVAGVAYGAKIVPVRVLGRCGGYISDIADGIVWASGGSVEGVPVNANPAKVINLSLSGYGACSETLQNAIHSARARNSTIVVAAGNGNENAGNSCPANCQGVITVAAVDRAGKRAYYSNYGSSVDVAAPGGDITISPSNGVLSTLNTGVTTPANDHYEFYQGTSMATPHVAGMAALMLAVNRALTPDQIESMLKNTVQAFPSSCPGCGTGIINAVAAVTAAKGGASTPACASGFTSYSDTLNVSWLSSYKPGFSGYPVNKQGILSSYLIGPATANFNLYLEKKYGNGWTSVAGAQTLSSNEKIDYSAQIGTYRWRVYSQSGKGAYLLCVKNP